jgi:Kef-type K+ transport system membrane component KefB
MLLPVVAIDDAVCLIVYAASFGVARALMSGSVNIVTLVLEPTLEVVCSLLLGAVMGYLLTYLEKHFDSNSKRLSIIIAFVMLTVALSMMSFEVGGIHIAFSSLLVCMMCGTVFCNICNFSEDMMGRANKWTAPLYVLFFALSGAELELSIFGNFAIVCIGIVYVISRSAGKIFGASISARLTKCEPTICKYLGITLLPQAGVALGMSVLAAAQFGEEGAIIRNIVLFSVLIYELVGPLLTKMALTAAGEIKPKPDVKRGQV